MSDRRPVLIYTSGVLPTSETFVLDQARGLRRWRPTLVGRYLVPDGLDVPDFVAPEMRTRAARQGAMGEIAQRLHRRIPVLRTVVDRSRPQLIHAHFLTGGYDVLASLRPLPCPVVVTAHGFDATWYGSPPQTMRPEQWLHGLFRRRLLRSDVNFIAVSHFIRDELIRLGAEEHRVVVHHTGVDTEYFTPPVAGGKRRGLLFVGRLVEKKGVLDLLRAVTTLQRSGTDVPVEIIGDGPMRPVVERHIHEHGLDAQVRGPQPRHAVREAMQRSALLCSPSRTASTGDREGFGMVLAEAQATGLPVIAARCGGMVDAVDDGRTGLLVEEGSVHELVNAIGMVMSDDELRGRLGASARSWVVKEFSLERQNAALEGIYDEWGMHL